MVCIYLSCFNSVCVKQVFSANERSKKSFQNEMWNLWNEDKYYYEIFTVYIVGIFNCWYSRCIYEIHAVEKEEYDVLVKLARGIFSVSVKDRTRIEKNAVVNFWRAILWPKKGRFWSLWKFLIPQSFASRIFNDLLAIYLNSNKQLVAKEARNFLVHYWL